MSGVKYLYFSLLSVISLFCTISVTAQVQPDIDSIRNHIAKFNQNFQRYPEAYITESLLFDSDGHRTAEPGTCVKEISSVHFQGELVQLKRHYRTDSSIYSIRFIFVNQKLAFVSQQQLIFPGYYHENNDQIADNLYNVVCTSQYYIKDDSITDSIVTGLKVGEFIFSETMEAFNAEKNQIIAVLNSTD